MDMLDKLIVNHKNSEYINEVNLNEIKDGEILFEFNEYECIELCLQSHLYSVGLECLSYKIDGEEYYCDNILSLENKKTYMISENNESLTIGYIPAKYHIVIRTHTDQILNCFFKVNYNKEVGSEGMENIIQKIEGFICGLSIDFFRQAPIRGILNNEMHNDFWIHEVLMEERNKIRFHSNRICNNFKLNVSTDYTLENFEKKQNGATIRKNLIKTCGDKKCYNVKKVLTAQNEDNLLLKRYLVKILSVLESVKIDFEHSYMEKKEKVDSLERELLDINRRIDEKNYGRFSKVMLKAKLKSIEPELEESEKWCEKISDWNDSYNQAVRNINLILHCEELERININSQLMFSASFYNNPDYRYFMELYNKVNSSKEIAEGYHGTKMFINKKSYELFEIYGFIVLQNILKEFGFSLIKDSEKNLFQFSSDEIMTFENEDNYVDIYYDHFCPWRHDSKTKPEDIVTVNSGHCKPDYILAVFDKNRNFKDLIVVDLKYRRLKNMISLQKNCKLQSATDEVLTDYSQLEYNCERKRAKVAAIIYPSMDEQIIPRFDGVYVGINVLLDFKESEAYDYLKKIISDILN